MARILFGLTDDDRNMALDCDASVVMAVLSMLRVCRPLMLVMTAVAKRCAGEAVCWDERKRWDEVTIRSLRECILCGR